MKPLRIVFMGTPQFASHVLETILKSKHLVVGVVTTADKPAGRGRKIHTSAVKQFAEASNLPVLQPVRLKDEGFINALKQWQADVFVVVAFRMLPEVVWKIPPQGTFNLHASLLPEYRGAAPINWAIINQESKTGLTTFFIDDTIDTGAIIAQTQLPIQEDETAGSLHDKLMLEGGKLVNSTLNAIANNTVQKLAQPITGTFKEAPKLNSENTKINWHSSAKAINAFVRGLNPYPTAWTTLNTPSGPHKVKVFTTKVHEGKVLANTPIGAIEASSKQLFVQTAKGCIEILELQLQNKKRMDTKSFLNGFSIAATMCFS